MKLKKTKSFFPVLISAIIALGLSIAIQSIFAWTAPTASPPSNNVATPLNSGPLWQTKAGSLTTNTDGINPYGLIVEKGNAGIGTTTPSANLTIQGTVGKNSLFIASSTSAHMMSLDTSGRLRIGEFNPSMAPSAFDTGGVPQGLIISGANKDLSIVSIANGSTYKGDIDFFRAQGTVASPANVTYSAIIVNNTDLGQVNFRGYYNNAFTDRLVSISAWMDNTLSVSSLPTRLEFHVTNVNQINGENGTPEMVIKSSGNVGIGEASPGAKLSVSGGLAVGSAYDTTAVSDGNMIVSGNVGIGTTNPNTKLDVDGVIRTRPRSSATCDANNLGAIYYDTEDRDFRGCRITGGGSYQWATLNN